MLKVKVIDLPVFYDGKRYSREEELIIKEEHLNEDLFEVLEEIEVETEREKELKKLKVPELQELLAEGEFTEKTTKPELISLIIAKENQEN